MFEVANCDLKNRYQYLAEAPAPSRIRAKISLLNRILFPKINYEDTHFVINTSSPLEAIEYRMEQQGLTKKDLADILGYKSRVSDIFHKTRKLNLGMIRKLYDKLHIPLETLVKAY